MQIFIQTKSIGSKKPALVQKPYTVPDSVGTLRALIEAVVRSEVERYNNSEADPELCRFLSAQELEDRASTGRISFGRIYSERKADAKKAVSAALLGFEDGLFKVVVGETVADELDAPLPCLDGTTVTFIRLTFLSGAFWF